MKELLNTLKPLELSLDQLSYAQFKTYVSSITDFFKFNCIDFEKRVELMDYVIPSLRYINDHLSLFESDEILDRVDKFYEIVEHMDDAIIEKNCDLICKELRYERQDFDLVYFTFLWVSLTTNMKVRLEYNYGWMKRSENNDNNCCCNCCDCPLCDTCPCSCCKPNKDNQILEYRPIQEPYYPDQIGGTYLERW